MYYILYVVGTGHIENLQTYIIYGLWAGQLYDHTCVAQEVELEGREIEGGNIN